MTQASIDSLDQRLKNLEELVDAGKQINVLPTASAPNTTDNINIQTTSGDNFKLPLLELINSFYILMSVEGLSAGSMVNIFNDSGVAKIRAANASNGRQADAFVLDIVNVGTNGKIYVGGINSSLTLLAPGEKYYLSEVPGNITTVPPTGVGKINQYVGKALSDTDLLFQPNPPIEL